MSTHYYTSINLEDISPHKILELIILSKDWQKHVLKKDQTQLQSEVERSKTKLATEFEEQC